MRRHPRSAALLALTLSACGGATGKGAPVAEGADTAGSLPDCAAAPLDCDGLDNDCDGVVDDGGEADLWVASGEDADGDGWSVDAPTRGCPRNGAGALLGGGDCDDHRPEVNPGAAEACLSAGDEDCDGTPDCGDPACAGQPCVEACAGGLDEDADGAADCADVDCWGPACPEDCDGPGDEDADGLINCEDADCPGTCTEYCDERDGDRDGLTGCADPDCALLIACWADLYVDAEGIVLQRSLAASGSPVTVRSAQALSAEMIFASGWVEPAGGEPVRCSVELRSITGAVAASSYLSSVNRIYREGLSLIAAPPPSADCPAFSPPTLTFEPAPRLSSAAAPWLLAPGAEMTLLHFQQRLDGRRFRSRFNLQVDTATGSVEMTTGSGTSWARDAAQRVVGHGAFEVIP
jgi:hypothetical protein